MNHNLITQTLVVLFWVLVPNTPRAQDISSNILSRTEIKVRSVATKKPCQLASFPVGFKSIEDRILGQFDIAGSEAGSGEFSGCEKSKYVFDDKKVEIYHDGERVVAVKRIFADDSILFEKMLFPGTTDLNLRFLTFFYILELPKLTGKDLGRGEALLLSIVILDAIVGDATQLAVGKPQGATLLDTRMTIWRKHNGLEVEFLPQKTFLQFKRKGIKR